MPELEHINGSLRIDPSTPLTLDLPLISAEWIQLDGHIKQCVLLPLLSFPPPTSTSPT